MRKTEVQYQLRKLDSQTPIADIMLAIVSKFTYFGSTVTAGIKLDIETQTSMAKAFASFRPLNDRLWRNKCVSTEEILSI